MKLGRKAEALPCWQELTTRDAQNQEAWLNIARCARQQKLWSVVIEAIERLLDLSPGHAQGIALLEHAAAAEALEQQAGARRGKGKRATKSN